MWWESAGECGGVTLPGLRQLTPGNTHLQYLTDQAAGNMDNTSHMSASHQYRKVMKPLLERKRRARINGCLDELKELMEYLGAESGQRLQRLEKADVLEVTVNHLKSLKAGGSLSPGESLSGSSTFRTGYSACASEVASFIFSPYSGVQQEQAARIARVVAEGMGSIQGPAQVQETMETKEELEPNNRDSSLPLDLSVK